MFPTPTFEPPPVMTPVIEIPAMNDQFAIQAVAMWNKLGDITNLIQIGLLLVIVLGGIMLLMNALKEI